MCLGAPPARENIHHMQKHPQLKQSIPASVQKIDEHHISPVPGIQGTNYSSSFGGDGYLVNQGSQQSHFFSCLAVCLAFFVLILVLFCFKVEIWG